MRPGLPTVIKMGLPSPFKSPDSREQAKRLLARAQGGLCGVCGCPMAPEDRSLEHVLPRARGGRRSWGNLTLSHVRCNLAKGRRAPTGCELIWLEAVNARLEIDPTLAYPGEAVSA